MASSVVRDCLVCGFGGATYEGKKSYQEISVCPKCNGAFVDIYHIHKYREKDWKPNKIVQKKIRDKELRGIPKVPWEKCGFPTFEGEHFVDKSTSLLVIELEDIKSNPIVKYKGEKLKFLQEVNLSWGTSDEKGISDLELLIKRYATGFKTETIKIETDTDV